MDRRKLSTKTIVQKCPTCNFKLEYKPLSMQEWKSAMTFTRQSIKGSNLTQDEKFALHLMSEVKQRAITSVACNRCEEEQVA